MIDNKIIYNINDTYFEFIKIFSHEFSFILPENITNIGFNNEGQMDWLLNNNIVFITHRWNEIARDNLCVPRYHTEFFNSEFSDIFKINNKLVIPLDLISNLTYHDTSFFKKVYKYFQKNLPYDYLNNSIIKNKVLFFLKAHRYWSLKFKDNFPNSTILTTSDFFSLDKNIPVYFKERKLL